MPPETQVKALLERREAHSLAKFNGAVNSLLGKPTPGAPGAPESIGPAQPTGLAGTVHRHPLAAVAVAVGAGFALAPGRSSREPKERSKTAGVSAALGQVLVASRLFQSVTNMLGGALGDTPIGSDGPETVSEA